MPNDTREERCGTCKKPKCDRPGKILNATEADQHHNDYFCHHYGDCSPTQPTLREKVEETLLEKCADIEHDRWSKWMEYLFSKCERMADEGLKIPMSYVSHWRRQIQTSYAELSEREKESDRKEVRRYLPLVITHTRQIVNELLSAVPEKEEHKDFGGGDCGDFLDYGTEKGWNLARKALLDKARGLGLME